MSKAQVEAWLAGEQGAHLPPILQEGHGGHPKRHHSKHPEAAAAAAADSAAAVPGGRRQLAAQPAGQQALALAIEELEEGQEREQHSNGGSRHGSRYARSSSGSSGDRPEQGGGDGKEAEEPVLNLFAFPGMDNFGGVSWGLRLVAQGENCRGCAGWVAEG